MVLRPSRRDFLRVLAGNLLCLGASRMAGALPQVPDPSSASSAYPFVEIPSAASGVSWEDRDRFHAEGTQPIAVGTILTRANALIDGAGVYATELVEACLLAKMKVTCWALLLASCALWA